MAQIEMGNSEVQSGGGCLTRWADSLDTHGHFSVDEHPQGLPSTVREFSMNQ